MASLSPRRTRRVDDLAALASSMPTFGSTADAGQGVGPLDRELLDLHAALLGAHGEVGAVRAVEKDREVVLLGDRGALGDHDAVHGVALDVHAEDLLAAAAASSADFATLTPPALPRTAGLDLRLDHDDAAALRADLLGRRADRLGGVGHDPGEHGNPVRLEHVPRLVLEQVHASRPIVGMSDFVRGEPIGRVWTDRGRLRAMRPISPAYPGYAGQPTVTACPAGRGAPTPEPDAMAMGWPFAV
jgi:hypothetical protein